MHPFVRDTFKIFSLNLVFRSLIKVCLTVGFFVFILFEAHIVCRTCGFILLVQLETFSAIIFPDAFSFLFFLLSSWNCHDKKVGYCRRHCCHCCCCSAGPYSSVHFILFFSLFSLCSGWVNSLELFSNSLIPSCVIFLSPPSKFSIFWCIFQLYNQLWLFLYLLLPY